ncbi:MAG: hypothetical protein HY913_05010 [Desulfomonile tiedjei]|nr:hypothetical protein [Desulfomonile tiedjei]
MSSYRYCTPEWLEESAKTYNATPEFEVKLKKVSWKFCFKVQAEPDWGIDQAIIFGAFFNEGKLTRIGFFTQEQAVKEGDFLLAAPPQGWKRILRKESKFTADFMGGKIKLEHGDIKKVVMVAPYANTIVDAITRLELQFPDEMTADELEAYRTHIKKFRAELGV